MTDYIFAPFNNVFFKKGLIDHENTIYDCRLFWGTQT
jgi:hypothetical protein